VSRITGRRWTPRRILIFDWIEFLLSAKARAEICAAEIRAEESPAAGETRKFVEREAEPGRRNLIADFSHR